MFYVTHYAKLLFIWNRIEQKTLTFLISPFKMTRERDSFFTLYIENKKYQIIISYKDLASIFYFNSIANFIAYPINQMVIPWNFWLVAYSMWISPAKGRNTEVLFQTDMIETFNISLEHLFNDIFMEIYRAKGCFLAQHI